MPLAALVCPHCEKPVELQVTAVTRSRRCPQCSKHIMLQFAQKQGRVKRKALLVNAKGGLDFDSLKFEVPVEDPQPLPFDAFERMKADPELIAIKKRFAWSIGAVAALVVVATIFHLNRENWFPGGSKPVLQPVADDGAPVSVSAISVSSRIASAQRPDKKPESLDFKAPDKPAASPAPSSRAPQNPTLSGGPPRIGVKNPIPGVSFREPSRGGEVRPEPMSKMSNIMGTLPKSLFRIANKAPATQVEHDLAKAKAALTGFLRAANVEQRLRYIGDTPSIESRVRAYYQMAGDGPVAYSKIVDDQVVGNGVVSEHDVVLANGEVLRASVIKAPNGSYFVDWPSFVAEGEMEWQELMSKKVARPVMLRVAVEPGDFFAGDFGDYKWLLCLKLVHPAHPASRPIFAYVERQSVLGREMDYWLKLGETQAMPMTVRVKYPANASADNQVWLSELVAPGWLLRAGQPVVEAKGSGGQRLK
jgi:DNA-directed RNA polymerase subunit RPC12/RpoP